MAIRDWPAAERPREKLLLRGAATLSDAELLAIFLRTGIAGRSAVDLARDVLQHFGGVRGLFEVDCQGFCAQRGLGQAKYAQLQAVLEMARRYLASALSVRDVLQEPSSVRAFLTAKLRHEPHEVFACLFLDSRHRMLAYETLSHGTIDSASVYPRQVIKRALAHNAAALILCHNHPSGVTEASLADLSVTRRISEALAFIDVRLLDHFIIGEGEPLSMRAAGML